MKSKKTTLCLAICGLLAAAAPAMAQIKDMKEGYLNSSSGIVRSGTGLCWRTGSWTPALAIPECEGGKKDEPIAKRDEPALPQKPARVAPAAHEPNTPVAERSVLAGAVHFAFGKSVLNAQGKAIVDDLAAKALAGNAVVEYAKLVGHADRIGNQAANSKLAMDRASAVAARLISKGIPASAIEVSERGSAEPVSSCKTASAACLAPDRRVEIVISIRR